MPHILGVFFFFLIVPMNSDPNSTRHSALSQVCRVHNFAHAMRVIALSPRASTTPTPCPVATQNFYRDTRSNNLCSEREFSVAIENFKKSVATENSLSRQRILCCDGTHLSYTLVRARHTTLSQHNLCVMTQGLPTLTTSCRDIVHSRDTRPNGLCRDKETIIATLVAQSHPKPCHDTQVLS